MLENVPVHAGNRLAFLVLLEVVEDADERAGAALRGAENAEVAAVVGRPAVWPSGQEASEERGGEGERAFHGQSPVPSAIFL